MGNGKWGMENREWGMGNRTLLLPFDLLPFGEAERANRAGRMAELSTSRSVTAQSKYWALGIDALVMAHWALDIEPC